MGNWKRTQLGGMGKHGCLMQEIPMSWKQSSSKETERLLRRGPRVPNKSDEPKVQTGYRAGCPPLTKVWPWRIMNIVFKYVLFVCQISKQSYLCQFLLYLDYWASRTSDAGDRVVLFNAEGPGWAHQASKVRGSEVFPGEVVGLKCDVFWGRHQAVTRLSPLLAS